jgi:glucarate dehydratase
MELARICRTWNIGLSMHSNSHIGISLAAMTHLGAAVPNLTYACDTRYPWQAEEIVGGGKLHFEDGALAVPTSPGLGVELDRAQLKLPSCAEMAISPLTTLHDTAFRIGMTMLMS